MEARGRRPDADTSSDEYGDDLKRLSQLWNDLKDERRRKETSRDDGASLREANKTLKAKIRTLSDDKESALREVGTLRDLTMVQQKQIEDMRQRLENSVFRGTEAFWGSKNGQLRLAAEDSEKELRGLRDKLKQREEQLAETRIRETRMAERLRRVEEELLEMKKTAHESAEEITQLRLKLDEETRRNAGEASLRMELELLRADKRRLIQLLKNTSEYRRFAAMATDAASFAPAAAKASRRGLQVRPENEATLWAAPSAPVAKGTRKKDRMEAPTLLSHKGHSLLSSSENLGSPGRLSSAKVSSRRGEPRDVQGQILRLKESLRGLQRSQSKSRDLLFQLDEERSPRRNQRSHSFSLK